MDQPQYSTALIVGAGAGLSASLGRAFRKAGIRVALAAREVGKLDALCGEIGASAFRCEATELEQVRQLFRDVESKMGSPDVVVYNASARSRGPFVALDPKDVERAISVSAFGGFLVAQEAARRMLPKRHGAILFTGASASVKGYPQSAPFAMGKFALRGLAQSVARELAPQGIHVAHIVIDGAIRNPAGAEPADKPDSMLDPDAIAASYLHLLRQPRSAWT
jgi:NAD(P)-dependent dehydrogenase (short-subunit alcohol dehydrogenase family)